jgi:hypothetical protein
MILADICLEVNHLLLGEGHVPIQISRFILARPLVEIRIRFMRSRPPSS